MNEENRHNWVEFLDGVKPLKVKKKVEETCSQKIIINTDLRMLPILGNSAKLGAIEIELLRKLRKNIITIEARLDLHGYQLDRAYEELLNFIIRSFYAGYSYLLVVTGKSSKQDGRPTIRSSIKEWIENSELINIVHSISCAADIHGGSGAMYLKLKKNKGKT